MSRAEAPSAAAPGGVRALSKITPPGAVPVTPNRRLFAELDAACARPVVWIHGLPGAGKTSLAASWLAARERSPLWYRVDDGDADPASLFLFLSRAAAAAAPAIAAHLPRLTPQHALPAFARTFFRALFSHAATSVLVLDDYHEIAAGSAMHALLAVGLAEAPPGVTVLVVGRMPPPVDFSRMRANGQLAVIGPEALTLGPEEARALLRDRDAAVPDAVVETIVARTHGWAAGLVLILEAHAIAGGSLACPASTVSEALFDYFAGEVFHRMDASVQDHLLSLAFLPAMTEATAARLTGSADAVRTLERLARRGYFTTRDLPDEDRDRPGYRFHPLFHAFLRATARAAWPPERVHETRLRAARLLEEAGQPEPAIQLLAEAEAWAELAGTILRWARALDRDGRVRTLANWLDRLPPGTVAGDGWLSYWAGSARMGSKPAESRTHFARARTLFERTGDTLGLLVAELAYAESIRFDPFADNAELDRFIAALPGLLERQPVPIAPEIELRVAAGMYAALERRAPKHPEREAWRDRALDLAQAHPQGARYEMIAYGAVAYDLTAGRLAAGCRRFEALPAPETLGRHPFVQQLAYFALAFLQVERHVPGDPGETARAAIDAAQLSATGYWLHYTLALATHHAQSRSDLAGSEHWLATIRAHVDPASLQRSAHHLVLVAYHDLLAGRPEAALQTARRAVACSEASGWHRPMARVALAQTLQILGRWDEAESELGALDAICAWGGPSQSVVARWLLLANAHFAHGRDEEGRAALGEAFLFARRHDIRVLRTIQAISARLLARAIADGIEADCACAIARRHGYAPPDADVEAWPWPLKIATFGGLAIRRDDAPLAFGRKTPRRLIELLKAIVAFGGTDVPETRLVDALWPDEEGDAARQSLSVAIHRLRRLLGDAKAILVTGGRVGLNPALCWLDLWSFERLLDGKTGSEPAATRQERALALYRGDFLAGDEDLPWAAPRRDLTRRRYVRACADLAASRRCGSDPDGALALYRQGIAAAPTEETLYRGLMVCHRERGERAEGMAVFRQLESVLAEAGRRPAPESIALDRALAGR